MRHAEKLQDCEYRNTLEGAKRWLKSTIKKINDLEMNGHEFLKYWIGEDARIFDSTKEFFKKSKERHEEIIYSYASPGREPQSARSKA